MNINARSIVVCCKAAIPAMEASRRRKDHQPGFLRGVAPRHRLPPLEVSSVLRRSPAASPSRSAERRTFKVNAAIAPGMIHSEGGYGVSPAETREAKYKMFPHPLSRPGPRRPHRALDPPRHRGRRLHPWSDDQHRRRDGHPPLSTRLTCCGRRCRPATSFVIPMAPPRIAGRASVSRFLKVTTP